MSTKILAIDPGIKRVGWAIVEADQDAIWHRASGIVPAEELSPGILLGLVKDHSPDIAAVERPAGRVFGGITNITNTAFMAGQVYGWLDALLPVRAYFATDWRLWLTGSPSAKDAAIAAALQAVVKCLPKKSNPDSRDAMGLGAFGVRQYLPGRKAS